MIESLVEETNHYAQQALMGKKLSPRSRFKQWVGLTVGEMQAFLGLIVGIRLIVIENMAEYWRPLQAAILRFSHGEGQIFFLIQSFFHVADNRRQFP